MNKIQRYRFLLFLLLLLLLLQVTREGEDSGKAAPRGGYQQRSKTPLNAERENTDLAGPRRPRQTNGRKALVLLSPPLPLLPSST
ncbi:hypothetical protein LY78DRAFT_652232 [Colletotrichum sublineola]|nr:hypothetical protein LY78DRAFT_652232 [Colletotrichum sublineola]